MTNKGIDIKQPKLRGEWAELRFMARAAEFGLRVSKPFGDSARYDVTIEHDGQFVRVQVKSTMSKHWNSYACDLRTTTSVANYCKGEIDFIAAYVIPADVWYITPVEVAAKASCNLTLSPHLPDSKYAPYQEAWHLLCGKKAKRHVAATPPSASSEASASTEDCDPLKDDETSPDDAPPTLIESRFGAIKWNPVLSYWKPR
jgi:hypothetical protein